MDPLLSADLENQSLLLEKTLEVSQEFLEKVHHLPTTVSGHQSHDNRLSPQGQGGELTLKEFKERFEHTMVASGGPRYWGFVTGGSTPAALMGDMLASVYDQNTQTDYGQGDISARIEFEAMAMLRDLFSLPDSFTGGFVTGATMSNFTCLGVARQWIGAQQNLDVAKDGVKETLPVLAATPHSSAIKALAMLGIGSRNVISLPTAGQAREAIDIPSLKQEIEKFEGRPFILLSSGGTVNTVDFDDMQAIAGLKKKYPFWWHIDAAFGGFAAVSTDYSHLLSGWELADSITIDGHKWLNVPYDNAFFFVRNEHRHLQMETFQNSNAPYLGDPMDNFNYLNFLPENSRRCRALPVWFTLKAYGKTGYREIVDRNIGQAQRLGKWVEENDYFELLAPVRLNTVCFTLKDKSAAEVQSFLHALNARGKVFMTPTTFTGKSGIRAALVNWRTTDEDIDIVCREMMEVVREVESMPEV